MKGQTRKGSLIEQILSTAIGLLVALITQVLVFPLFNIYTSISTNIWIATIFTIISVIRGYLVRRGFNALHKRGYFME